MKFKDAGDMGLDNMFEAHDMKASVPAPFNNRMILSVKEGANFRDTDLMPNTGSEKFLKHFAGGLFTVTCKSRKKIKFVTPNLKLGTKTPPEKSIFSNSLAKYKYVEIDYKIQTSEAVKLSIELFWYSKKSLIKKTRYDLPQQPFNVVTRKLEMIDIPPLAETMGVCVFLSGEGKVKVSHFRIRRSMGKKAKSGQKKNSITTAVKSGDAIKTTKPNQKKNFIATAVKSDVAIKTAPVLSHKLPANSHLRSEAIPTLQKTPLQTETKVTVSRADDTPPQIKTPSKKTHTRKKLKRIKVHPLITKISQDSDAFIRDAILYGITAHPSLANDPYKLLMNLIKDRREHAVLAIIEKYNDEFEARAPQIYVNVLYALFKMPEVINYYQTLPANLQAAPFFTQRYHTALAWTHQNEALHAAISQELHYPGLHTPLLKNFIRYAELLNTRELKVVTHIILNNAPKLIDYFSLMSFYDLLIRRDLLETAQLLTGLIQSKAGEGKREGRINYNLLLTNVAFHCENYTKQLHYLNTALRQSKLLTLSLKDPAQPVSADNILCEKDDLYKSCITHDGPLITVIMTTWNSSETLSYAVKSVLDQTHRNIELIIVD
ncbi:MAG: glycosyltransferase, partial [Litorimonas sp.]